MKPGKQKNRRRAAVFLIAGLMLTPHVLSVAVGLFNQRSDNTSDIKNGN